MSAAVSGMIRTLKGMARQLTLKIKGREYRVSPVKIERRKLYGWTEIEAVDDSGEPCVVVSADESGKWMIPQGGMAVGLLSPRGEWVERGELEYRTADGRPVPAYPSSYDTVVELGQRVSAEECLLHDITDVYALDQTSAELVKAVGQKIYTFDYCYSDGCAGSPAFVLASGGGLFLLVGRRLRFEMVGYDEPGFAGEAEQDGAADEEVDFAMF